MEVQHVPKGPEQQKEQNIPPAMMTVSRRILPILIKTYLDGSEESKNLESINMFIKWMWHSPTKFFGTTFGKKRMSSLWELIGKLSEKTSQSFATVVYIIKFFGTFYEHTAITCPKSVVETLVSQAIKYKNVDILNYFSESPLDSNTEELRVKWNKEKQQKRMSVALVPRRSPQHIPTSSPTNRVSQNPPQPRSDRGRSVARTSTQYLKNSFDRSRSQERRRMGRVHSYVPMRSHSPVTPPRESLTYDELRVQTEVVLHERRIEMRRSSFAPRPRSGRGPSVDPRLVPTPRRENLSALREMLNEYYADKP